MVLENFMVYDAGHFKLVSQLNDFLSINQQDLNTCQPLRDCQC